MKVGYLKSLFLPSSRRKSLNSAFRALRPYQPYTARQQVSTTTLTNPPSITILRFQERVSFLVGSETPRLNKTGNVRINVSLSRVHIKHCRSGEAIIITYSECVPVALIIHHAPCLSPAAYLPVPYFPPLSRKRHDFRRKWVRGEGTEHKMCVLISSTNFVSNISRSKKILARYYHKCTSVFV